jgi:hypothetical protein
MRRLRLALFLVALVHGALYALAMPPWQSPDEVAHFESSHLLAALARPISSAEATSELGQPILSSLYQLHAWTFLNRYGAAPNMLAALVLLDAGAVFNLAWPFFYRSALV